MLVNLLRVVVVVKFCELIGVNFFLLMVWVFVGMVMFDGEVVEVRLFLLILVLLFDFVVVLGFGVGDVVVDVVVVDLGIVVSVYSVLVVVRVSRVVVMFFGKCFDVIGGG